MIVDLTVEEQRTNHLCLNFSKAVYLSGKPRTFESTKYTCGLIRFKVKLDNEHGSNKIMIFVLCEKAYDDDTLKYECVVLSDTLQTSMIIDSESDSWKFLAYHTATSTNFTRRVTDDSSHILNFDLKIHVNVARSKSQFAALVEDTEFTDFELRASDGSVNIHKVVLITASDVFQTMLKGEWKETKGDFVHMRNTSVEVLRHLKDFIYLQKLPKKEGQLKLLAELGCMYMMPEMVQKCCVKLLNVLTEENALDLIEFAVSHKITRLLHIIIQFIREDIVKVDSISVDSTKWG